jgi:hypothetical protein
VDSRNTGKSVSQILRSPIGADTVQFGLIAAYLDAVVHKDGSAVDRFFAPDVEYIVNGSPVANPAETLPPISADCAFWSRAGGGPQVRGQ